MSAQHASTRKVQAADLASKRRPSVVGTGDVERADALLSRQRPVRVVPLPEPVEVPEMVNRRPLADWEAERYEEWANGRRRAELAMFGGLIG